MNSYAPEKVQSCLYGSIDGVNYQLLANKKLVPPASTDKSIVRAELTFSPTSVRYIKLQLKNPNFCPSDKLDGTECGTMFLDEIEAW